MKWTKEKPLKEGWYWFRPQVTKGCRYGQYRLAYIVYVDGKGLFETIGEDLKHINDVIAQWSDTPIEPPAE